MTFKEGEGVGRRNGGPFFSDLFKDPAYALKVDQIWQELARGMTSLLYGVIITKKGYNKG